MAVTPPLQRRAQVAADTVMRLVGVYVFCVFWIDTILRQQSADDEHRHRTQHSKTDDELLEPKQHHGELVSGGLRGDLII